MNDILIISNHVIFSDIQNKHHPVTCWAALHWFNVFNINPDVIRLPADGDASGILASALSLDKESVSTTI